MSKNEWLCQGGKCEVRMPAEKMIAVSQPSGTGGRVVSRFCCWRHLAETAAWQTMRREKVSPASCDEHGHHRLALRELADQP